MPLMLSDKIKSSLNDSLSTNTVYCAESQGGKIGVLLGSMGAPERITLIDTFLYLRKIHQQQDTPFSLKKMLSCFNNIAKDLAIIRNELPQYMSAYYNNIGTFAPKPQENLIANYQTEKLANYFRVTYNQTILFSHCHVSGQKSVENCFRHMSDKGCDRILFFPLFPQTPNNYKDILLHDLCRVISTMTSPPTIRVAHRYYDNRLYIKLVESFISSHISGFAELPHAILLIYNGNMYNSNEYNLQCLHTTQMISDRMNIPHTDFHTMYINSDNQIYNHEKINLKTVMQQSPCIEYSNIVIAFPGNSYDTLGTLSMIPKIISTQLSETEVKYISFVPCPNDKDQYITMLADAISNELQGWLQNDSYDNIANELEYMIDSALT